MEGIWYMAVYKDKNKNTWYVSKRYTDWDGSKKRLFKRGFQTKREALEYELSFVSKISDNQKMLLRISSLFTMKIWKSECVRIQ